MARITLTKIRKGAYGCDYRSVDGRFDFMPERAFEDEFSRDEVGTNPVEWFLYDGGTLVDAYPTLREARQAAERLIGPSLRDWV